MSGEHREQQTRRIIRLFANTMKERRDSSMWLSLYINCLPLCVYKASENGEEEGWFHLILTGDAKGEIYGWEANSFLQFRSI